MSAAASAPASSSAVRRLRRDLEIIRGSENPQIVVRPSETNLLEWHFVLHSLPTDTPYKDGVYHGVVLFPPEYPLAPPAILMVTPSGRLEVGRRLCLSMTDFHPESWNPAWSVETILVGLLSFFVSDAEKGYGSVLESEEKRRQLATASAAFNERCADFTRLFPDFTSQSPLPEGPADAVSDTVALEHVEVTPDETAVNDELSHAQDVPDIEVPSQRLVDQRSQDDEHNDDEPLECWICRSTIPGEGLIQPCACRGSMSGVHASCVEQWIQHHRRNAVNAETPRCSVCQQPYRGDEHHPGMTDFARHLCYNGSQRVLRSLALVILLVAFQVAAQGPDNALPLAIRVLVVALFNVAASHKTLVLTVSLPPHRAPPHSPLLRRFFVADYQSLAMHIAEAISTMFILGIWCLSGVLSWPFLLAPSAMSLVPLVRVCARPSLVCIKRFLIVIFAIVLTPLLIPWTLINLARRYPRHVVHPLGAGPHLALAIAGIPLCLVLETNVPVVVLWASHSFFLAAGILEMVLMKRLRWQEGPLWWFTLQTSALSAYVASACCEFPKGFGSPGKTELVVRCVSTFWLILVCGLTVRINWSLCVRYYRTWQHRHGTFRLEAPTLAAAGATSREDEGGAAVV